VAGGKRISGKGWLWGKEGEEPDAGDVLEYVAELYSQGLVGEEEKRKLIMLVAEGELDAVRRTLSALQYQEEEGIGLLEAAPEPAPEPEPAPQPDLHLAEDDDAGPDLPQTPAPTPAAPPAAPSAPSPPPPFDDSIPDPDDDSEGSWLKLDENEDASASSGDDAVVVGQDEQRLEFSAAESSMAAPASDGDSGVGWGKLLGGALVGAGIGIGAVAAAMKKADTTPDQGQARIEEVKDDEEERKEEEKE
jgi:hypothetical protein